MPIRPSIIPVLVYADAPAAIDWLCRAFGFERHLVVPGEHGDILHAQLVLDGNMVMLSTVKPDNIYGLVTPLDAECSTMSIAVTLAGDPDAHYARAVAADASIVTPLADWDYGGRGYTARDGEGNVWTFGSYDPWA